MTLYFVTGNKGKVSEAKESIPSLKQVDIDLPEVQSMDVHEVIRAKLEAAKKSHVGKLVVEDTALSIGGLGGLPGPLIKWFLASLPLEKIAQLVEASGDASAEALTVVGYHDGKEVRFFEGRMQGKIVLPRGERGFGWDRMFQPDGHEKTLGEMKVEEKNRMSMRKEAFSQLAEWLEKQS